MSLLCVGLHDSYGTLRVVSTDNPASCLLGGFKESVQ